ncbi:MAG: type IV pilus secretin PilQ [Bdellovibrionales bacterium]|nr:type IV pilus secretin PilQ [Oligoflexia bacterium]
MKSYLISTALILLGNADAALCSQISAIDFKNQDTETLVEISGDGLIGYTKEEKQSPPQLVLTFDNATLAEQAKQKFDMSTLGKGLVQVSSYSVSGGKARVVIDFAKAPNYTVEDSDQKITLHVLNSGGGARSKGGSRAESASNLKIADSDAITTIMSSEKTQKFTGSPITLKLKDADVHEVLRMISETSGFNIVIHPAVVGKITVSLEQVPWDQALDVVLTTLKLSAERNESVLRVMPREVLTLEKQQDLDNKKLVAAASPRVTRIFPVSYADLGQLSALLLTFANSQNNAPGSSGIPATILVDQNTQSLVVRDTAENVERMRKMIQLLDVQTPQVLVEAKVVEASEDFSKSIDGQVGLFGAGSNSLYGVGINSPTALGLAGGAGGGGGGGATRSNGFAFTLGNTIGINASLTYAEKLSKAKVVSSPKTVVLSGKSSVVNQTTAYGYTVTNPGAAGIAPTTSVVSAQANTKLDVTPRVTNDGSVFMKLNLSRDVLNLTNSSAPVAEPRTMSTEVIVESGNTLVIGGVLNMDENSTETGFPILRKIPILGWLFGSESNTRSKRELMFFITPRILNQKKTALADPSEESPKM